MWGVRGNVLSYRINMETNNRGKPFPLPGKHCGSWGTGALHVGSWQMLRWGWELPCVPSAL